MRSSGEEEHERTRPGRSLVTDTPARTYPSDSEARPVGMSKTGCYRKIWSQSTAMMNYEFGSPFIPTLLGESANWPAAARAFGEPRGCVPGPPLRNIWSRRTTMMNSLVGSSFTSRHRGVSSKNQRRGARAFLGLLGAAAPSGQVAEARSRAFLACRSGLQQPQWSVLRFWWRSPQIVLRSAIFLIRDRV